VTGRDLQEALDAIRAALDAGDPIRAAEAAGRAASACAALSAAGARLGREEGQTVVEYALVMLLVAVALAGGVFVSPFRSGIADALGSIADAISTAGS